MGGREVGSEWAQACRDGIEQWRESNSMETGKLKTLLEDTSFGRTSTLNRRLFAWRGPAASNSRCQGDRVS